MQQARNVEQPDVKDVAEAAASAAAEAARHAKDISVAIDGLVLVDPNEDLTGDGGGNTGNSDDLIGMSPDEFADRFGASKTAGEVEAENLANRFGAPSSGSSAVSDWSRSTGIVPDYTTIPTGGLASTKTKADAPPGAMVVKNVNGGAVTVDKLSEGGGQAHHDTAQYVDGRLWSIEERWADNNGGRGTTYSNYETGWGTATDNSGSEWQFQFGLGWIDRTQTGEEQTTNTLPPPSCGSASCNALRRGLGRGSLVTGGIRSNPGPDGATTTTQAPSVSALINRDDLVKTNIAGGAANSQTNRTARELENKGVRRVCV